MLKTLRFFAPVFMLVLCACSSSQKAELDYSLAAINSAVESQLTMGIQRKSENGRTFFSRPFVVKQENESDGNIVRQRGRAKVEVSGDRRPYTIDVSVDIEGAQVVGKEQPSDSDYSRIRSDNGLAKKLLSNISATLERRGQYKNFIDDFRPF
ncbi:MAG: hypothetical protein SGI74_07010 [Oligoflexia bacterium]|nr:hypothetical protein [Oligoflexia bacterium]